jgi:hypothetical protein
MSNLKSGDLLGRWRCSTGQIVLIDVFDEKDGLYHGILDGFTSDALVFDHTGFCLTYPETVGQVSERLKKGDTYEY